MAEMNMAREYEAYLYVLKNVQAMREVELGKKGEAVPSAYWREELDNFDYMFEAPPSVIRKLRQHCFHLTGDWAYDYRTNKSTLLLKKKLDILQTIGAANGYSSSLLVPEPRDLGGYGFEIDGQLHNFTTLRFYEIFTAMESAGLLDLVRNNSRRNSVVEIGSGWGGLAYRFKLLFPETTYFLIDLPEVFLFSAVYLKTMFPDARIVMYGELPLEDILSHWHDYDFIFLPTFALSSFFPERIDLAINTASFQEMTTEQVDSYLKRLSELGCRYIYSYNREKSTYNDEIISVSSIISSYYDIEYVSPLDLPSVNSLTAVPAKDLNLSKVFFSKLRRILFWGLGGGKTDEKKADNKQLKNDYKHLKGILKNINAKLS